MGNIKEAIAEFEKYNKISLKNYVSDNYLSSGEECLYYSDNYIGKDIFENHVYDWLEFFSDEDKEVFFELLKHYRYFTKEQFRRIMKSFFDKITMDLQEELQNILFVTFPSKKGRASGGDQVRAALEEVLIGRFNKDHIIADTQKVSKEELEGIKYIVFVDDVVGSGKTMYKNIVSVYNEWELAGKNVKLFIAMVYVNEEELISKIGELQSKKGIVIDKTIFHEGVGKCFDSEQFFLSEQGIKYKEVVLKYEEMIAKNKLQSDKEKESILGFDKGQLLVSFHYNTPNNTLSTFWRPSEVSVPLFTRGMYIRPTLAQIKENKKRLEKNAYKMEKLKNVTQGT